MKPGPDLAELLRDAFTPNGAILLKGPFPPVRLYITPPDGHRLRLELPDNAVEIKGPFGMIALGEVKALVISPAGVRAEIDGLPDLDLI